MTKWLLLGLLWTPPVFAAECPWGETHEVETASATMTHVTVNGHEFHVRGFNRRDDFMQVLYNCGATLDAETAFNEWRDARRSTNSIAFFGLPIAGLGPIFSIIPAVMAGNHKDRFITHLYATPEVVPGSQSTKE